MRVGWLIGLGGLGLMAAASPQGRKIVQTVSEKKDLQLKWFAPSEFGTFWLFMSNDLLVKLDDFRAFWGAPVQISPVSGAIGRRVDEGGTGYNSQHNIANWGEVRAVDIFPEGMVTQADMRRAVDYAQLVGFSGIGVYPDWKPSPGLHVDVREGQGEHDPATWSASLVDGVQTYFPLSNAIGG